jgi:phospholipid/cholesterol/gamma-HCH transport system permease protein
MPDTQPSTDAVHLEIRVDVAGNTVIRLAGRLDVDSTGSIWDRAVRALPGSGAVIVDAAQLDYLDGAGISLLDEMAARQRKRDGSFRVEGLQTDLRAFFDLARDHEDAEEDDHCPSRLSVTEIVGQRTSEIGEDVASLVSYVGQISLELVGVVLRPHRTRWAHVLESATTAGAFALPVVVVIGFLLGWVLAFSAAFIMHDYGADTLLAALIGPAMVRELGPLMTCIVLAARSGSAFAAEIGTMKVNEELDALTTMGIDPVRFLVIPKVLAAVCMTPLLAAFANLAGVIGGALVSSVILGQPLVVYTNLLKEVVSIQDIGLGLGKAVIFGVIVAAIGCIRGMQTRNTPTAVGESATSAVVTSIVFLAITDALLAVVVQVLGI